MNLSDSSLNVMPQKYYFPMSTEVFPMGYQSSILNSSFLEGRLVTQAPDSMVFLTMLSAMSVALQGLVDVETPVGKTCPVAISALTVAESGERKSTVENLFSKGLKRFQKEESERQKTNLVLYKLKLEQYKMKVAFQKKRIDLDDEEQCNQLLAILQALEKERPIHPRLTLHTFEDSTIEAFLNKLNGNVPNGYLASSEGGVLLNSRAMLQTAKFNAIWSGDDVTIDRKTAASFTLVSARMTTYIMTQWSALERYLKKSKDDVRGNGYLSRFLVCIPLSNCGLRQSNGVKHPINNINTFNDRAYELLCESAELSDYSDRKVVRFTSEAKGIWFDIYNDIESKMGPGGMFEYAKDHASKLAENIARVAALIHCFDKPITEDISVGTLLEATYLVSYFSGQFMKAFCAPPKYLVDAENLMKWFLTYTNSGFRYVKRNHILQCGPYGTRKKQALDTVMDHLKSKGLFVELVVNRTRVIDLLPAQAFDAGKFHQDLSVEAVL